MTTQHEASRTLVKSPPELWAECSDAGSLARHLGEFGDITITRLEPETTVAWEGEHVSGTVRIEPSGWGTRVTLTAQSRAPEPSPEPEARPAQQLSIEQAPEARSRPAPIAEATDEEADDATLEKAVEAPDQPVASDTGALRIRWRRMTTSMRMLFRSREPVAEQNDHESSDPELPDREPAAEQPSQAVAQHVEPPAATGPTDADEAEETPTDAEVVLRTALDSLGQAHHRPFSRA